MRGRKIVATVTDRRYGYKSGDVLRIVKVHGSYVDAKNLTVPGRYGVRVAFLHRREFDLLPKKWRVRTLAAEYRVLGIPIVRKYTFKTEVAE